MSCVLHPATDDVLPCGRCGRMYCHDCLVLLRDERVCAECKHDVLRDVISGAVVERIPLARMPARAVAYVIDRAMFYLLLAGILFLDPLLFRFDVPQKAIDTTQMILVFFLIAGFAVYEGLMLGARGQTLGKMAAKVRVVRRDGTPITRRQAWARAVIRTVFTSAWYIVAISGFFTSIAMALLLGNLDLLVGVLTPQHTALHDLLARTRVFSTE